jgi:hypothetical protein
VALIEQTRQFVCASSFNALQRRGLRAAFGSIKM